MMRLLVLNGPNLDLLGTREPEIYGSTTLEELVRLITGWGSALGIQVEHHQSNHEGELIDAVHHSGHDGIVINPGALTHTSRALADAIAGVGAPTVEIHISNVMERETWRRESVLADVAVRRIYGRGLAGYRDAIRHHVNRAAFASVEVRYGPHPDNIGDLRRGGRGLVTLIHGGFWRHEWARDTMESLSVDLARRGLNTWNIEYRRLGTGGGWPASAQDVLTALDFAPRVGEEPVSVIGHSAGGHLGLWAAPRSRAATARVVGLAAITDLDLHASSGGVGAAEARTLLEQGAPPSIEANGPPISLFHGRDDELVPPTQSERLSLRASDELTEVSGGHFHLLDPTHEHWERVIEDIPT